ncbi:Methyltransferase-like protein 7A, partial [Mucuna pruriens]
MNLHCASSLAATISSVPISLKASVCSINEATHKSRTLQKRVNSDAPNNLSTEFLSPDSLETTTKPCFCGRRHFIETATLGTTLFPIQPSRATDPHYTALLNKFHPPRPDWYEEFYASVMNSANKSYEAEVARYKSQIFSNLKGKGLRILEIGIGTGPNLSYYASGSDVEVIGIDPNPKMEKYARSSAALAGLPPSNFEFIQAVGEAIPLSDASVDAVVGTLVLCSVKDVDMTLKEVRRVLRPGGLYVFIEHVAAKDGTFLKFIQGVLDPLQQTLADGCHLSRETGDNISSAEFSSVELNMAFLSSATFINPHAYGIAYNLSTKMNVHCASSSLAAKTFSVKVKAPVCSFNEAINKSHTFQKWVNSNAPNKLSTEFLSPDSPEPTIKPCFCGRRHFKIQPSRATDPRRDYSATLKKFRPPRPDWYEELYAWVINSATKAYEAEVARYKSQIFSNLKGEGLRILEIGIGTGPNLSYYASGSDVEVVGIDPNPKMEKYARSSAASAGLPPSNFEFIQAVGEFIPLSDASVDAVVGTLVLCSVKDVHMTLQEVRRVLRPGGLYVFVEHVAAKGVNKTTKFPVEMETNGTFLKFIQRVLDPLQQTLSDGCHLSRETGKDISRAGFSSVELNTAFLSSAAFVNPHAYGIAYK